MAVETLPVSRNVTLRLALDCDFQAVRPMTLLVGDFLREQGSSADEVQAAELSLAEACNNAIKYVSGHGRGEKIPVEVVCGPEQIELHVNDNTNGFDWPEEIRLPDVSEERGRGLFLIHSLMDQVKYYRGRGQNWLVMLRKRRIPDTPKVITETERRLAESERIIRDMAEELSFCYESLSAIFRCSAELGKSNDQR